MAQVGLLIYSEMSGKSLVVCTFKRSTLFISWVDFAGHQIEVHPWYMGWGGERSVLNLNGNQSDAFALIYIIYESQAVNAALVCYY